MYNDDLGTYEKKQRGLYEKPNLPYIGCKRLELLEHVWRAEGDVLKNILKINKKRPLRRPRKRWKDPVEKNMRLIDGSTAVG